MLKADFNRETVRKSWKHGFKTKLWKAPECLLPIFTFIKYGYKKI